MYTIKIYLADEHCFNHFRYSANLVCGLGVIHVVLGVLSALFSVCALFSGECYEVNMPASGLWCGFIYVGAGILGLLASKKWYVRRQIFIFLLASTISLVSSASCIVITSVSIHNSRRRYKILETISEITKITLSNTL